MITSWDRRKSPIKYYCYYYQLKSAVFHLYLLWKPCLLRRQRSAALERTVAASALLLLPLLLPPTLPIASTPPPLPPLLLPVLNWQWANTFHQRKQQQQEGDPLPLPPAPTPKKEGLTKPRASEWRQPLAVVRPRMLMQIMWPRMAAADRHLPPRGWGLSLWSAPQWDRWQRRWDRMEEAEVKTVLVWDNTKKTWFGGPEILCQQVRQDFAILFCLLKLTSLKDPRDLLVLNDKQANITLQASSKNDIFCFRISHVQQQMKNSYPHRGNLFE